MKGETREGLCVLNPRSQEVGRSGDLEVNDDERFRRTGLSPDVRPRHGHNTTFDEKSFVLEERSYILEVLFPLRRRGDTRPTPSRRTDGKPSRVPVPSRNVLWYEDPSPSGPGLLWDRGDSVGDPGHHRGEPRPHLLIRDGIRRWSSVPVFLWQSVGRGDRGPTSGGRCARTTGRTTTAPA